MARPNIQGAKSPSAKVTPRPRLHRLPAAAAEALTSSQEEIAPNQDATEEADPAALVFEATGLGDLPEQIQSTAEMDQRRRMVWDTYDSAVSELEELGLPISQPQPPVTYPRLTTEDVLNDDSRAFSEKYAECLAWEGYLKTVYANISAKALQAENAEKILKADVRKALQAKPGKKSAKDLDDQVATSLDYQAAASYVQRLEQQKLMVKALLDQQTGNLRTLSRQVTINQQELEAESIKNNLSNRRSEGGGSPLPILGASRFSKR
jgi:hypothetical protein